MQKVTYLKTQTKKDLSNYVNIETGETLVSESKAGTEITVKEKPEYFTINSNEYIIFDSAAINYLNNILPKADVSRIYLMSNMLKGDCSVICQSNNHPHNSETLPIVLDLSQDKFYKLVRKLVNKNILTYCVCAPSGYVQKIYMLNPYIARKRKTINCELNYFFKDITKNNTVNNM